MAKVMRSRRRRSSDCTTETARRSAHRMPDLPSARIAHLTTRRLRIKVPEKRRDVAFFDFVQGRLAAWDSVERVETNPLTASILVHFSDAERAPLEMDTKNLFVDIDFDGIMQPAEP